MKSKLFFIFIPLTFIYILFILIPIIRAITFEPFSMILSDLSSGIVQSIIITYILCAIVAGIAVAMSLPYAYVMSRKRSILYRAMDSVVDIPIMIPHTVVGIIMLLTFEPTMPLGNLLTKIFPGYSFDDTVFAVIVTLFFLSSAYSIREIGVAYQKEIMDYENVAQTLGISEGKSFLIISIRLLLRAILKGFLLSWARSVSEVGAILIVAYYILPGFTKLAGVFIYSQFIGEGLDAAAASSTILILTGIIVTAIFKVVEAYHAKG